MARDSQGNDLQAVDVQLTGLAAVKFGATSAPTQAQLESNRLPSGYEYIGLFLEDGGYAEEVEAGDRTYFFQQGYSIVTGDSAIKGTLTPAEDNDTVWTLCGIDTTSWVRSDVAYQGTFGLIITTRYKNGNIVTRGGLAHVLEVSPSGEERGKINSVDLKFEWEYQASFNGHYRIVRSGTGAAKSETRGLTKGAAPEEEYGGQPEDMDNGDGGKTDTTEGKDGKADSGKTDGGK